MSKHNASDLDVDTFDYNRIVGLIYKNKKIVDMSAVEAWSLGVRLMRCARLVDPRLAKEIEL